MIVCRTLGDLRSTLGDWRRDGCSIGFVPTMGCLHEGHMSLVDHAARLASRVVLSIYVNPTQFGPGEDFAKYPRDFGRDEALCRGRGVDAVFYPDACVMYAPDHSTWVDEGCLSLPLCGRSRPGHFRGVTTVVAKLFNMVQPDVAVFGRKDAQQLLVIQRMVRDLNFPVQVVGAPIVREADGLAMSSRNLFLSEDERRRALSISQGLAEAESRFTAGERDGGALVSLVEGLVAAAGGLVDYVELVSRETLQPLLRLAEPALLAVAARFGNTRLIDNVFLG